MAGGGGGGGGMDDAGRSLGGMLPSRMLLSALHLLHLGTRCRRVEAHKRSEIFQPLLDHGVEALEEPLRREELGLLDVLSFVGAMPSTGAGPPPCSDPDPCGSIHWKRVMTCLLGERKESQRRIRVVVCASSSYI